MFDLRDPASDPAELYKKFRVWCLAGNQPDYYIDYDLVLGFCESNFDNYPVIEEPGVVGVELVFKFDGIGLMLELWVAGGQLVQLDDITYVDGDCDRVRRMGND